MLLRNSKKSRLVHCRSYNFLKCESLFQEIFACMWNGWWCGRGRFMLYFWSGRFILYFLASVFFLQEKNTANFFNVLVYSSVTSSVICELYSSFFQSGHVSHNLRTECVAIELMKVQIFSGSTRCFIFIFDEIQIMGLKCNGQESSSG